MQPPSFVNFQRDLSLRRYLYEINNRRGFIEIVALDNLRDLPRIRIETLFVTPLLAPSHIDPDSDTEKWPEGETLFSALGKHKRVVILGDPGSGKSTLSNWLAWRLSAGLSTPLPSYLENCLPIPCVLRELPAEQLKEKSSLLKLADYITQNLLGDKLTPEITENIQQRIQAKQCIFIFDGLDEISENAKSVVRHWMQEAEKQDLYAVATSRIVGYEECPVDCSEGKQKRHFAHTLKQLKEHDVAAERMAELGLSFLSELSQESQEKNEKAWAEKYFLMPFDNRRIEIFAQNWYQQRCSSTQEANAKASDLFAALQRSKTTLCLARTPNLLALMAVVHRERADLPDGKALLYDEITNAYMNTIDQARKLPTGENQLAKYNWKERKNWLAYIAFRMQEEREWFNDENGVLVSEEKILGWLSEILSRTGVENIPEVSSQFIKWVAQRSGLLLPRGEKIYGFVHLSFQEYFCACYIKDCFTSLHYARNGTARYNEFNDEKLKEWAGSYLWEEVFIFLLERLSTESDSDWLENFQANVISSYNYNFSLKILGNQHVKKTNNIIIELVEKAKKSPLLFEINQRNIELEKYGIFVGIRNSDFEQLSLQTNLVQLLQAIDLNNLKPLEKLAQLSHLLCQDSAISDLLSLAKCKKLERLYLAGTQVSNLSPLAECKNLEWLDLNCTQVSDLSPLAECKKLKSLDLNCTQVSDLSPLAECKKLKSLDLSGTQVSNLSPLAECKNLERLDLNYTEVSDLSPLANLKNLQILFIDNDKNFDISPLKHLTNLRIIKH